MHPERCRQNYDERRSEPRLTTSGRVIINLSELPGTEIAGELLDVSRSGFRAQHDCRDLHSGQVVLFHHDGAAGRARVVWNRIADQLVESGFFVI